MLNMALYYVYSLYSNVISLENLKTETIFNFSLICRQLQQNYIHKE